MDTDKNGDEKYVPIKMSGWGMLVQLCALYMFGFGLVGLYILFFDGDGAPILRSISLTVIGFIAAVLLFKLGTRIHIKYGD